MRQSTVALLVALMLTLLPSLARAQAPPVSVFAGAGLYQIDGKSDFDRTVTGRRRSSPGLLVQLGARLPLPENFEAVVQYVHVLDADRGGADIQMPLGELRVRFGTENRGYAGVGGGISRGSGRKQSYIQTLVVGADFGKRHFAELRGIFDERDARLISVLAGVRF